MPSVFNIFLDLLNLVCTFIKKIVVLLKHIKRLVIELLYFIMVFFVKVKGFIYSLMSNLCFALGVFFSRLSLRVQEPAWSAGMQGCFYKILDKVNTLGPFCFVFVCFLVIFDILLKILDEMINLIHRLFKVMLI